MKRKYLARGEALSAGARRFSLLGAALGQAIVRILPQQMGRYRVGNRFTAKSGGIKVEPAQNPEQQSSAQFCFFPLQSIHHVTSPLSHTRCKPDWKRQTTGLQIWRFSVDIVPFIDRFLRNFWASNFFALTLISDQKQHPGLGGQ